MSVPALDGSAVAGGALPLAALIAVAAGFVSFASPCVLPLVPGFLGYVTGLSDPASDRRRVVLGTALFVLGFTTVFVAGMATLAAVSQALIDHRGALMRIGGVIVIVLALVFLGWGSQIQVKPRWRPAAGLAGAPLLGAVFAVGWSPCSGPTLAAINGLIAPLSQSSGTVGRGVVLAMCYSFGLGMPFLLLAAGFARAGRMNGWLRRHQRAVQRAGGILLLVVGVLLVTGWWDAIVTALQNGLIGRVGTLL